MICLSTAPIEKQEETASLQNIVVDCCIESEPVSQDCIAVMAKYYPLIMDQSCMLTLVNAP